MNSSYDPDVLKLLVRVFFTHLTISAFYFNPKRHRIHNMHRSWNSYGSQIDVVQQQQILIGKVLSRCQGLKETNERCLQFISDYHVCSNKAFTYFRHLQQLVQELLQRYEDTKEKLAQLEKKHEFAEFEIVQRKEENAHLQQEWIESQTEAARRIEEANLQFDMLYAEKQAEVQYYMEQYEKISRQYQHLQSDIKSVKKCRSSPDSRKSLNTFLETLKIVWQVTSDPTQVQKVLDISNELIQLLDIELDAILMCSLTAPTKFQAESLSSADVSVVLSILGILVNISASPYGRQVLMREENKRIIQHVVNALYIIPSLPAKLQSKLFHQKPTSHHRSILTGRICDISDIKELLLCFCSNLLTEKLGAMALLNFGIVSAVLNLITQETCQEIRTYGIFVVQNVLEIFKDTCNIQAMEPTEWVKLCPDCLQIPKLLRTVKEDPEMDTSVLENIRLHLVFTHEE